MITKRIAVSATLASILIVGGLALAGFKGWGPLGSRLGVMITTVQPEAVMGLGQGGDPLVVMVVFPWPGVGSCSGQFTVTATETDQEVRVSNVTSREAPPGTSCADIGPGENGKNAVALYLTQPLAGREVVRFSDGARLTMLPDPVGP